MKGERKDKKQNIGVHGSHITTFSDPTLFVTPKSQQKSKTKKPLPNPKPTKNIDKQHLKTKHQNQPLDHLSKILVNPELNTVDFGELQLSTQKPRHSRQQDSKDKNNALAALFNVAGGAGKSKSNTPKQIQKKKKKLKKTTNLIEGLKQSTRGKINKQSSNKSKLTKQSEVITKTFRGGSKITRKGKPSKRLPNKSDPLASLFSLIKEDGKGKNKPKTQKSSQTRKSNIPAITSERSQIQSSQRLSPTNTRLQTPPGSTRRGPSSRPNNISLSTRRSKPQGTQNKEFKKVAQSEISRSTSRNPISKKKHSPTIRPQSDHSTSISQVSRTSQRGRNKKKQSTGGNNRKQSETSRGSIARDNQQNIRIKPKERSEIGSGKRFNEILNKFGFGGKSTLDKSTAKVNSVSKTKNNSGTKLANLPQGISIKSKSEGILPESKKTNSIPNTTPFTVFNSPSTKAPIQIKQKKIEAGSQTLPSKEKVATVPTRNEQISNPSRGISLGKARRKPVPNSDLRISPIVRTTPTSRGRGTTVNPVSSR